MPFYILSRQMTFLPCESSHVSSINTLFECLVTFGADKWLLCCEDPFMILQITTCFKCLDTIAAGKWLLSCVCPFVYLQTATFCKCLESVNPLCIFNLPLYLNALSHLEQANGFSALRIFSWFFKSLLVLNVFSQLEQVNGFSPVCVLSDFLDCSLLFNDFSHLEQVNGFSPVASVKLLSCFFKCSLCLNHHSV